METSFHELCLKIQLKLFDKSNEIKGFEKSQAI